MQNEQMPNEAVMHALYAAVMKTMSSSQSNKNNEEPTMNFSPNLIAQVCHNLGSLNSLNAAASPRVAPDVTVTPNPIQRSSSIGSDMSTPLYRSCSQSSTSSMASSASSSSSSMNASRTLNFKDFEAQAGKRKNRKRRNPQQKVDAMKVTRPVMEEFDDVWLAPRKSPLLFKRRFKRRRNPDGTRALKKYPEIDMTVFKRIVRPILRDLLGDTDLTGQDTARLYRRYFDAALRVVKKRRANHVQSWRINGRPLPLVYSLSFNRGIRHDGDESQRQEDADESQQQEDADESQRQEDADESQRQEDFIADEYGFTNQSEDSHAVNGTIGDDNDTFLCNHCRGTFSIDEEMYPQDQPRSEGSGRSFESCRKCWEQHMRENVLPFIQDEKERAKQLARLTERPQKRKASTDSTETVSKKKKSRALPGKCKWCGATDHKTKRSKKCPFSKNYKKPSPDSTPVESSPDSTPVESSPDSTPVESSPDSTPDSQEVDKKSDEEIREACKKMALAGAEDRRNRPIFAVGSNVLARWKRKQWFLAHVFDNRNGRYSVYFPGDSKTKKDLPPNHVREAEPSDTVYTRGEILNKTFFCDGDDDLVPGEWKVRRLINDKNVFVCTRLTGGNRSSKNCEEFDIGYVIDEIVRQEQKDRES